MNCPTPSLNIPQTVFCLFYAIFWGLVANAQIRWKAFDWPLALAGAKDSGFIYAPSWKRIQRSIIYLMVMPILLFLLIMIVLAFHPPFQFRYLLFIQILSAVVAAHAIFGLYRIWLSGIERFPRKFYYPKPTPKGPSGGNQASPRNRPHIYVANPDADEGEELYLNPTWADTNRYVGLGYVILGLMFAGLGWFVGWVVGQFA